MRWGDSSASLAAEVEALRARVSQLEVDLAARSSTWDAGQLRLAFEAGRLAVWDFDVASGRVRLTDELKRLFGYPPDSPVTPDDLRAGYDQGDWEKMGKAAREALRRGDTSVDAEMRHRGPDGVERSLLLRAEMLRNSRGELEKGFGVVVDMTERRAMQDQLVMSESRLRLALNAGRMAVFEWPLDNDDVPLTDELRTMLGLSRDAASTVWDRRANYHPDDAELVSATRQTALTSNERFLDFEFRYFWPDGQMRWLQVRSEIFRSPAGTPEKLVGVMLDVTEQKLAEERLRLLAREVDHRANNLLSVVQSLVSLSRAEGAGELREVLMGRIDALAHAHSLLAAAQWSGADARQLIERELAAFHGVGRITVEGPPCSLDPSQAQAIGMAIHELATNAAKYGALSVDTGSVSVVWARDGDSLRIDWAETGGPPVEAPRHRGFGTTLLERTIREGLGGDVRLDWRADGLRSELRLPL